MDLLKELSLRGKMIFVVIHQPSSDIFKMFDTLIITDSGGFQIYYGNPEFHVKMTALVAAILFYYTLVRRAAARGKTAWMTGIVSLLLFAIVPLCGVLLGYE